MLFISNNNGQPDVKMNMQLEVKKCQSICVCVRFCVCTILCVYVFVLHVLFVYVFTFCVCTFLCVYVCVCTFVLGCYCDLPFIINLCYNSGHCAVLSDGTRHDFSYRMRSVAEIILKIVYKVGGDKQLNRSASDMVATYTYGSKMFVKPSRQELWRFGGGVTSLESRQALLMVVMT